MTEVKVTSGKENDKRTVLVSFDVPVDYAAAVERWGEAPVYNCFVARLLVKVQDNIRNGVLKADTYDAGTADALAQAEADTFVLDAPRAKRAAKPVSAEAYVTLLLEKKDAGNLTPLEAKILDAATS